MAAKDSLLDTLRVLKDCLSDPVLIDKAPKDTSHNLRAAMLRQGLAVLTFSAVESFIRERTGEVLQSFDSTKVNFSDFSPALQKAVTIGALDGVRFRLRFQPAGSKIGWLVACMATIAQATTSIDKLSDHAFAHAASNIDEDDVRDILKAFGVDSPWEQITRLTRRLGNSLLDSQAEFSAIKDRRHASAHARAANVLHADLLNSAKSSLVICAAFDLLLSHSRGLYNLGLSPGAAGRPSLRTSDIGLVFVAPRPSSQHFSVRKEQLPPPAPAMTRSTVRVFDNLLDAITYGAKFAHVRRKQLVTIDATSTPSDWATW